MKVPCVMQGCRGEIRPIENTVNIFRCDLCSVLVYAEVVYAPILQQDKVDNVIMNITNIREQNKHLKENESPVKLCYVEGLSNEDILTDKESENGRSEEERDKGITEES